MESNHRPHAFSISDKEPRNKPHWSYLDFVDQVLFVIFMGFSILFCLLGFLFLFDRVGTVPLFEPEFRRDALPLSYWPNRILVFPILGDLCSFLLYGSSFWINSISGISCLSPPSSQPPPLFSTIQKSAPQAKNFLRYLLISGGFPRWSSLPPPHLVFNHSVNQGGR